jgi:GNAT superfamily N-acetyltransferase
MLSIRTATIHDCALMRTMIRELAEFEHEIESVSITYEMLARDGFGADPKFRALIAEWDGQPAAFALFFGRYSTWAGPAIHLEDLFVRSAFRGKGIGTALLAAIARITVDEGCYGLHWEVLDWNAPAIDLYQALGAEFRKGWLPVRITDERLKQLAEKAR